MSRLKVQAFSISIDGYGAGPEQSLEAPLGVGGEALHQWFFRGHSYEDIMSGAVTDLSVDEAFTRRSFDNLGAWIMGRNMFGPVRGEWPDDIWRGWWGNNPPYHVPVFVLTRHARAPLAMEGGTTFHFVTGGIHAALESARAAAQGKDIRLGGGVSTVRQYLQAGLVDEVHLVISPTLLGRGEHLLTGIDLAAAGFKCVEHAGTRYATHVVLTK